MTPLPYLEFLLRRCSALLLGTLVGLERQWRQRMAGTRTNALVSIGAAAFVMCAFLVRDTSRSEAQIVSYVVSGVGFLGAGVIFKDSGGIRRLNTAATIWCSAAIGAICALGYLPYAATVAGAVLFTNTVLRPLAYRLHPAPNADTEVKSTYLFELICRMEDEAHIRASLLHAMANKSFTLTSPKKRRHRGDSQVEGVGVVEGVGEAG